MICRNKSTFLAAACLAIFSNIVWHGANSQLFVFPSALSSTFPTLVLSDNVAKIQQAAKIQQVTTSPSAPESSMSLLTSQPAVAFGVVLAVLAVVAVLATQMGGQQPQESHASKEKSKDAAPPAAATNPNKPAKAAVPESTPGFSEGQRVVVLDPPVLKGRLGTIVGPPPSPGAATVCFDGDSTKYLIFTRNLEASSASPAAPAATAVPAAPAAPAGGAGIPTTTHCISATDGASRSGCHDPTDTAAGMHALNFTLWAETSAC